MGQQDLLPLTKGSVSVAAQPKNPESWSKQWLQGGPCYSAQTLEANSGVPWVSGHLKLKLNMKLEFHQRKLLFSSAFHPNLSFMKEKDDYTWDPIHTCSSVLENFCKGERFKLMALLDIAIQDTNFPCGMMGPPAFNWLDLGNSCNGKGKLVWPCCLWPLVYYNFYMNAQLVFVLDAYTLKDCKCQRWSS